MTDDIDSFPTLLVLRLPCHCQGAEPYAPGVAASPSSFDIGMRCNLYGDAVDMFKSRGVTADPKECLEHCRSGRLVFVGVAETLQTRAQMFGLKPKGWSEAAAAPSPAHLLDDLKAPNVAPCTNVPLLAVSLLSYRADDATVATLDPVRPGAWADQQGPQPTFPQQCSPRPRHATRLPLEPCRLCPRPQARGFHPRHVQLPRREDMPRRFPDEKLRSL